MKCIGKCADVVFALAIRGYFYKWTTCAVTISFRVQRLGNFVESQAIFQQ